MEYKKQPNQIKCRWFSCMIIWETFQIELHLRHQNVVLSSHRSFLDRLMHTVAVFNHFLSKLYVRYYTYMFTVDEFHAFSIRNIDVTSFFSYLEEQLQRSVVFCFMYIPSRPLPRIYFPGLLLGHPSWEREVVGPKPLYKPPFRCGRLVRCHVVKEWRLYASCLAH